MKTDLNKLYGEAYPGMTIGDAKRIDNINSKNHYGINDIQLIRLINKHKKARAENDQRTMSMIEYRLTDINFHHECGLLCSGKYEEALKEVKELW